jgi:hypothetical protein
MARLKVSEKRRSPSVWGSPDVKRLEHSEIKKLKGKISSYDFILVIYKVFYRLQRFQKGKASEK